MTLKIKFNILIMIFIILAGITPGMIIGFIVESHISQIQLDAQQAKFDRAYLELRRYEQVREIMMEYHCTDETILQTIMETFDPVLIALVIARESSYNPNAISKKGCLGLMGLSPDKLRDWRNPVKNIRVGSEYFQEQIKRFKSKRLGIAAYNAGPENVVKYHGVPPFKETQEYIVWMAEQGERL